jgi:hypothetical protein
MLFQFRHPSGVQFLIRSGLPEFAALTPGFIPPPSGLRIPALRDKAGLTQFALGPDGAAVPPGLKTLLPRVLFRLRRSDRKRVSARLFHFSLLAAALPTARRVHHGRSKETSRLR